MTNNTIGWYSEEHAKKFGERDICLMVTGEYDAVSYLADNTRDPRVDNPFSDWKKIGPINCITYHECLNNGEWVSSHHKGKILIGQILNSDKSHKEMSVVNWDLHDVYGFAITTRHDK